MNTAIARFILFAVFVTGSAFAQNDYADQVRASAISQGAKFEALRNSDNVSIYERALQNLALKITSQNSPKIVLVVPAKTKVTVDPDTLVITVTTTQEPVSTKTIEDYLPKPAAGVVGDPVGIHVPNQTLPVFYDIGAQSHYLTETISVYGRTFIYYALGLFNRCWLEVAPQP